MEPERGEHLAAATEGNAPLRARVEALLSHDVGPSTTAHYHARGYLSSPDDPGEHPEAIGPYRILDVLGRGSSGIVYRAEQQSPLRLVALKVMRAGPFESGGQTRFDLEARALARLKHAGIAQIYEAGTADFGRGPVPFLAIELVEGIDLIRHARKRELAQRERVELLAAVCRAVQHAHQKEVVHRDLKPRNILVTEAGEPKVLDFGLARLIDEERGRTQDLEHAGQIEGTLAYMSPEQAGGDPSVVDVVSDVYALGATAYELLSGRPPFELAGMSLLAALHRVTTEIPPALIDLDCDVDRDLSAIVSMAMSRAKDDRYQTVAALGEDLQRWAGRRPVNARRVGPIEELWKYAGRNRGLVGAAAAGALTLVVGILGVSWYAHRAVRQAERAERGKRYIQKMLEVAGTPRTGSDLRSLAFVFDRAAQTLAEDFADDPSSRTDIAVTLGMSFFQIGEYEKAHGQIASALAWYQRERGPMAVETLETHHDLGVVLVALGRPGEAEEHLRTAYEGRVMELGVEDLEAQDSANWLGQVLLQKADPAQAEELFESSLAVRRRTLGEDALPTLSTRERLAAVWRRQGRVEEAERTLREVLAAQRDLCGPNDFDLYETLNNLGTLLFESGRAEEAERLEQEALAGYVRLRGEEHPDTVLVAHNLATTRGRQVPQESAPSGLGPALSINAAREKFYRGERAEAEADLRSAIHELERAGGLDRYLLLARQSLAGLLTESGRLEEARAILRDVLDTYRAAGTERSAFALMAQGALAEALRRSGRLEEALAAARAAWETSDEELGPDAPSTLSARVVLGAALADLGRADEAIEHAEAAVRLADEHLVGPYRPYVHVFRVRLGSTLRIVGRLDDAERELLAARAGLVEVYGERGPFAEQAAKALIEVYEARGDAREAARWRETLAVTTATPVEASDDGLEED